MITYGGIKIKIKGDLGFLHRVHHITLEEHFLSSLDLRGKIIYDIGGYIGILATFFAISAGKTGKVIVFEPNPENYKRIKENIELNGLKNVQMLNIGIGEKRETKKLVFMRYNSATGSMEKNIQLNILKEERAKSIQVEVYTLDNCIEVNKLPKPDFIKIDIEGMEYNALMGMSATISKCKPHMYIEIHGANEVSKIENIQKIVKFLILHGYSIYHVESKHSIAIDNAKVAKSGHIFCT